MSIYKQFKTSAELETKGITIDYGDFRVVLARAGGSNKKFARLLEAKTKPFRRAIQTNTMDQDQAQAILAEVYAEAVIMGWETKVDGKLKPGIEAPSGDKLLTFNAANVAATLGNLPELFADLQEQASNMTLFREAEREESSEN